MGRRYITRITIAIMMAASLLVSVPVARALDMMLPDPEVIRSNCKAVQTTLERVHSSDALARVNLGRQYEIISTKLMAPMNSRIALNRLDGVELARITVDFNSKLEQFRSAYQQYEQTMLRAIQINCVNQPIGFFDIINSAREQRLHVRLVVLELGDLTTQYGEHVKTLRASVKESSGE